MTNEAVPMSIDVVRVRACYETAKELLLAQRVDGHWVGELSASALSTATAVSALSLVQRSEVSGQRSEELQSLIDGGVQYLIDHQSPDGGWGDTDKSYSNIATTYLCVAAIHLSNHACGLAEQLRSANQYIQSNGAIEGLKKRYGVDKTFVVPILTNCALAGLVPWSVVDPLPFELAVVPQKWYRFVGMPVVSYAIPALVAIGQAKYFHSPPWNPLTRAIRSLSVSRSLKVLRQMQPASGGYLEAVPLTSFVVMSLAATGRADHEVTHEGVKFLVDSVRFAARGASEIQPSTAKQPPDLTGPHPSLARRAERGSCSWPIDTNLATWVTTLALNALAGAGEDITQVADLDWLLKCQHTERHPFTGANPGGWGWSDLSGAVPDADDTPGAILALQAWLFTDSRNREYDWMNEGGEYKSLQNAMGNGREWLHSLQNRDGGWPTFCRGWGRLPFDRSGSDLTAHAIRALVSGLGTVTADVLNAKLPHFRDIDRGFQFIERHQRPDGSWVPLWFGNQDHPDEENPIYGTAKVLMAYRDTGRTGTPAARRGFEYLLRSQNADGGWGGGASIRNKGIKWGDQLIESTVEETALAVEALLARGEGQGVRGEEDAQSHPSPLAPRPSLARGLAWLCAAVDNGSLLNPAPIGFYFAKLWYYERLYPLIFTVSALGRAVRHILE